MSVVLLSWMIKLPQNTTFDVLNPKHVKAVALPKKDAPTTIILSVAGAVKIAAIPKNTKITKITLDFPVKRGIMYSLSTKL